MADVEGLERDTEIVIGQSDEEQIADAYTMCASSGGRADDGASLQSGIDTGANTLIILDGDNGPVAGNKTLAADERSSAAAARLRSTNRFPRSC